MHRIRKCSYQEFVWTRVDFSELTTFGVDHAFKTWLNPMSLKSNENDWLSATTVEEHSTSHRWQVGHGRAMSNIWE